MCASVQTFRGLFWTGAAVCWTRQSFPKYPRPGEKDHILFDVCRFYWCFNRFRMPWNRMCLHAMYFTIVAYETVNALKYTNCGCEDRSGQLQMHGKRHTASSCEFRCTPINIEFVTTFWMHFHIDPFYADSRHFLRHSLWTSISIIGFSTALFSFFQLSHTFYRSIFNVWQFAMSVKSCCCCYFGRSHCNIPGIARVHPSSHSPDLLRHIVSQFTFSSYMCRSNIYASAFSITFQDQINVCLLLRDSRWEMTAAEYLRYCSSPSYLRKRF